MSEETRLEVIKALAYDVPLEDIANMAEVEVEEIQKVQEEAADEIRERKAQEGF